MCYFFPGRGGGLEKAVLCFVVPPHSTPPFFFSLLCIFRCEIFAHRLAAMAGGPEWGKQRVAAG